MIVQLMRWSARHSGWVIAVTLLLAGACELARRHIHRDLLPELGEPRISVVADWMGHPALELATRVTRVLTGALQDLPGATAVRGSSMSGMGYVEVVLGHASSLQASRQAIEERLSRLRPALPPGVRLQLGPVASSSSWTFQYVLVDPTHGQTPRTLRQLHDAILRPALARIPGVAEVASVGGQLEQVQVDVRSSQLAARGLAFTDAVSAVEAFLAGSHAEAGLAEAPLPDASGGAPARLGDVAQVRFAPDMAPAITEFRGTLVNAGGVVVVESDADVPSVLARVRSALGALRPQLPYAVEVVTVYDRSEVIGGVQRTLLRALTEEIAVVAAVVLLFLLHFRSALVPALTLPVVVLLTFGGLWLFGIPATLISLGGIGIALGLAVDADVVTLEACHRRLERTGAPFSAEERREAIQAAVASVGPAVLTSLAICAVSFLPVLAFSGETGRLLRPLAASKTLVIAATVLVALTLGPALRDRLLRGRVVPEFEHPLTRSLVRVYRPFVRVGLERPILTLLVAGVALLSAVPIALRLGAEFLPRIDEGDLLFMPTTFPGPPMAELAGQLQRQDQALRAQPEVSTVFGKLGRAETATDPAPLSMAEINLRLHPRETWPKLHQPRFYSGWAPPGVRWALQRLWPEERPATVDELTARLDRLVASPGWSRAWTAPARARLDMVTTGIRTPVGLRVVAEDPARLDELSQAVRAVALRLSGTRSAVPDSLGGERWPTFRLDPRAVQNHRIDPARVSRVVELLVSGGQVAELVRDGRPLRVRVRLDPDARGMLDQLRAVTMRSSGPGAQPVPLVLLGHPEQAIVPASLRTEGGELVEYVPIDLDPDISLQRYVEQGAAELHRAEASGELSLRPGERIDWIGQYPLLVAGEQRLRWIAPAVLLLMIGLLYLQFRSLPETLIVLASVPFALVGSVWTLHLLGYALSAPVWVGLLSATGLAMQTGVVMVVYIDEAFHRRLAEGRMHSRQDVIDAHAEGTVRRLRPKLMTVATMAAGLLPLMWAEGTGAEILRRAAAPMLGGLLTSAFLTLEVLPVLYTLWRVRQLRQAQRRGLDPRISLARPGGYSRTSAATEGTPLVSTRKSM